MKKLLLMISLGAFWLLGYYCGRQEGSPDVLGWGRQTVEQVRQGGGDQVAQDALRAAQKSLLALVSPTDQSAAADAQAAAASQDRRAEEQPAATPLAARKAERPRPAVPQCW